MTSFGTIDRRSAGCRPALGLAGTGLLGGSGQLAAGRVGLAAIEQSARVLGAAGGEEKSMVQHGYRVLLPEHHRVMTWSLKH
jgi:hypothetical protein